MDSKGGRRVIDPNPVINAYYIGNVNLGSYWRIRFHIRLIARVESFFSLFLNYWIFEKEGKYQNNENENENENENLVRL